MNTTNCKCSGPGYCETMKRICDPDEGRKMSEGRYRECSTSQDHYDLFISEIDKPCKGVNGDYPRKLLGDRIADILASAGITPETVSSWLGSPCNCEKRKKKINEIHQWALGFISGKKDRSPIQKSEITKRNLIMHVYPVSGKNGWRENAKIIRRNMNLFNGKRIVSIATTTRVKPHILENPEEVKDEYGDGFEFLEFRNIPKIRETRSFIPMMEMVESDNPNEATFYCHSKGCTHDINDGTTPNLWRDAMYETLLNWDAVKDKLESHAIAGSFRRNGGAVPSPWHYSGTFFWFRHDATFSREWREAVKYNWLAVEAWPGKLFSKSEAACVFKDGVADLYDKSYWDSEIQPELNQWRKKHGQLATSLQ